MLDRYTLHVTAGVAIFLMGNIYALVQHPQCALPLSGCWLGSAY
jgi:hypothetical protein